MSQHDYVIENQTFPATRTDINNALAAVASTNAGSSAPSTTYAHQLWYDTTANKLKQRNADNDAWIDLFDVDQTADTAALSSGLINGDFTVDTDTFHVDSTNNRVGVGTVSPSQTLHLKDETSANIVFEDTTNGISGYVGPSANNQSDTTEDRLGIRGEAGIAFSSGANTLMRMSSGGSLGIGAATDQAIIAAAEPLVVVADGSSVGTNEVAHFAYPQTSGGLYGMRLRQVVTSGVVQHTFATYNNGTEYAQNLVLDRGGVRIGSTTNIFNTSSAEKVTIKNPGNGNALTLQSTNISGGFPILYLSSTDSTASQNAVVFQRTGGGVGTITTSASATAYNTSSDYRLKTAVTYDWDATTRLKQLKPARFKWIVDGDDAVFVDGFLAHEAQAVVPEAVTGTKDETRDVENVILSSEGVILHRGIDEADWTAGKLATTDDDGNTVDALYPSDSTWAASHTEPVMQGIDQAKIVPLLCKTILELEARITALEAS